MRTRTPVAAALVAVVLLLLPVAVAVGHSELDASSPADGETVVGSPPEIVGDFTEAVDAARSSMALRGAYGTVLARGGVPADGPATRMAIVDVPALAPGRYEVRWTTVTPDDEGVERGTFTFTVAAAPPPTATPGPATGAPVEVTPEPTPMASPSAAPSDAPAPEPSSTGASGSDQLIPLAALGLIVAVGFAWYVRRRR